MSIVYFLLLCRDFSLFTANFNDYGSSVITLYIILKGLDQNEQNEAHVCNTNDFRVEIFLGF